MKPSLLLLAVLAFMRVHATDPATSASNVQFSASAIDGGQFALTYTAGSGNGRIVVVKSGSDITGTPVDGTVYTPGSINSSTSVFAAAGTGFTGAGEWVVSRNTSAAGSTISLTLTGLQAGSTYYVAIFEFSTSSTPNPDYSNVTPVNKFVTTLSAPTTPAKISGMSQVIGNKARITFTSGNGSGRMIVGRKGTVTSALPENYKYYNANASFGSGSSSTYILDAETFVLVKANSLTSLPQSYDISNLEPNTQYTFTFFEYNGANTPVYLASGSSISFTTAAGPTQASTGVSISGTPDGNALSIFWDRGNGSQTIVVARKGSPVTHVPVNGQTYAYNASFGSGAEWVAGSGEYVVSRGTGNSVTVTNLEKSSTYYLAVFTYDADASGNTYYLTTLVNKSLSTALPPTAARSLSVGTITGSTAQLIYGNIVTGNGGYRMLVIREDAPITFTPTDLTLYSGGTATYGSGTPVATGTYVLYGQTNGGAPTITNLSPGHTYYVACWDWNGSSAPVYLVPGGSVSITIPNEPTTAATLPSFPTIEGNSIRFDWTAGNGARRIVIARKGAPVSTMPADASIYTASTVMGSGTEMGNGLSEYVVYNNTGNSVTVTNLDPASTYYFAVVEYNNTNSSPDYLTNSGKWLSASKATYSAPGTQVSALGSGTITSTTAVINFTVGNGSSRLFVVMAGSAVNASPTDLQSYSSSLSFMSGSNLGSGNYVVGQGNTTSFTISNLTAGTTYYVAAFEYNGSSGPVYLTPAATYNFTTTGGIAAPTQAAQNATVEAVDGNHFTVRWTSGDGAGRVVVARKSLASTFTPANGTTYTANAAFGSGTNLGDDQFIVYNGSSNTVTVSNLDPESTYYFAVYEYNGSGATSVFRTASFLQASGSTATAPSAQSSAPAATATPNSLLLNWTAGNGAGRLVLAKAGSAPGAAPANLTKYPGNSNFGDGPQLASGEYVIYAGTGNSVSVTGLSAGTTYYFKVIEYNGNDAPVYNTSEFLAMNAATSGSTLPVSWLYVRGRETATGISVEWATAQEQQSDHFVVERSIGASFRTIATVSAAGNSSSVRTYSYMDADPPAGIAQYRLRQVDLDGHYRYSAVASVRATGGAQIMLLQNPVRKGIPVRCNSSGTQYQLLDASGRTIATGTLVAGMQTIATGGMVSGTYFLRVITKEGSQQAWPVLLQ
jgi:hypothetical protein